MSRLSSPVPEMDEDTRRHVESIDVGDSDEQEKLSCLSEENVEQVKKVLNFDENVIIFPWNIQSTKIDEKNSKIQVVGVENIPNNYCFNLNCPDELSKMIIIEDIEMGNTINNSDAEIDENLENFSISQENLGHDKDVVPYKDKITNEQTLNENYVNEEHSTEGSAYVPNEENNIEKNDEEETLNEEPNTSFRKRARNEKQWTRNILKTKRQKGDAYVTLKGKNIPKRDVKGGCSPHCTFLCMQKFTYDDRKILHEQFWKLSDTKKSHYFSKYTERKNAVRKRTLKEVSRKLYTHLYYFELKEEKFRVCKNFFLNTLDISQQRIYYFFKKLQNKTTNVPRSPLKGKHVKKSTSQEQSIEIENHIKSFPTIESHYCRANSKKKYLDPSLNISRMYNLYKLKVTAPVSESIYRKTFNTKFNLDFYKPKKDRCDKCEEFKAMKQPTPEQRCENEEHLKRKLEGYNERTMDRERNSTEGDEFVCVVVFDLENVFPLPKCEVSSFFYKQKLNVYNLTAHCNINKVIYNCIWHEALSGRAGNDLASAVVKILKRIVIDLPNSTKLILWSDSCVPQNKNSIMSTAIKYFLQSPDSKNLKTIEQKFSEPGHGNLQEVDAAHSVIERFLRRLEIYSPLGLIRCLCKIPKNKLTFKVIQMQQNDFLNYQIAAATFKYSAIPYTKLKHIIYKKDETWTLSYRLSFVAEIKTVNLLKARAKKNINLPQLSCQKPVRLREDKIKHLKEALKFMQDEQDIAFYKAILKM